MRVPIRKGDARLFSPLDYHLSPEKYRELEEKLKKLHIRQPKEAAEVKRLAEMGDFSENAGYQLAKGRLRGLNQRIMDMENLLKRAEIVVADQDISIIKVGHRVTIASNNKETTYTIRGASESDPTAGFISHGSPLGAALLGHRVGEEINLDVNGKIKKYKIIKIEA
jgi:transcription elongation factor GreA